jgi:hypothetical protein
MGEVHTFEAGRSTERPAFLPDILLFRGRAGDGVECLVTFDRRNIVLSRPVAGLACKIRMSLRHYQAIAVVVGENTHSVRLVHREPSLCVDLVEYAAFEDAEDHRDRLSDYLDLPPLMLAGRRAFASKATEEAAPAARRAKPARTLRPRFLLRRRTGSSVAGRKIEGRELIARH